MMLALSAGVVTGIVGAGAIYQTVGARRSARQFPPPGQMIGVGGQRLHVIQAGSGTPAVAFEAGIAASSLSWTRVMPEVAGFARACAYDRAGLGWSDPSNSARTPDRMVSELRGVIAHAAAPGPVVLVGHSFGVFLVLLYAAQHPEDVAGLVLLDPPSEWQDFTDTRARLLTRAVQASHIGSALARVGVVRACLSLLTGGAPGVPRNVVRVFGPRAAHTLERLVGEVRKLPPDVHPAVQALWCQPKCFKGMAEHLAALPETGAAAGRIAKVPDRPIVVISGADQPPDILARHRELAGLSSRGRHVIAVRSGHWIHLDEPELVVDAIRYVIEAGNR